MATRADYRPRSVPEFLSLVERFRRAAGTSLWYRGCERATHPLIAGLYRHPSIKTSEGLADLERQLMTRFRQRSIPYHSRNLSDDWEALFFMQHYGVPTRLLDWTENPLIALHFALMSAPQRRQRSGKLRYYEPAVVWFLDPERWNRSALRHLSYSGGTLTPGDEGLKGYSPFAAAAGLSKFPVALYGAHNSARIVAQQGVFTIFGHERTPMEKLGQADGFSEGLLIKVSILPSRIQSVRRSLLSHGITESVVFPDLEGLARETKRHFAFDA